jgi:hypothetical protein
MGDTRHLFQSLHFRLQRITALFQEVDVFDCTEQDAALALGLVLVAIPTAFWPTARWHGDCTLGAGGRDDVNEVRVAVTDGVPPLLLGHDMVQPFLWRREQRPL